MSIRSVSLLFLMAFATLAIGTVSPAYADLVDDHINAAKRYMQSGQWDFANFEWRSAMEKNPNNVMVHIGLAESLTKSGLPADAIKHLKMIRESINDPELDVALAKIYLQQKNTEEAKRLFLSALNQRKFSATAYEGLYRMKSMFSAKDAKAADKFLRDRALEAYKLAIKEAQQHDYKMAAAYFEIVSIYFNTNKSFQNDYGLLLLLAGRHQEAFAHFDSLIRQKRPVWQVYANRAMTSISIGKPERAQRELEMALSLCEDPDEKAKLYNNLGYVYELNRQYTKSMFAYEKSTEINPTLEKAKLNLAYSLRRTERYEEALNIYKSILQVQPNNAEIWNQIGFVYELMFKPEKAIPAYEQAIRIKPTEKEYHYNLGLVYKKLGKSEKADEAFRRVADLEFAAIEDRDSQSQQNSRALKLMEFIDLFFANKEFVAQAP